MVIGLLGILMALLAPAVQNVRARAAQAHCSVKLRQVGLALHHFHDVNGRLPPTPARSPSGEPGAAINGVSWLTFLTPFLEQEALWKQCLEAYQIDPVPYHNPPHKPLAAVVPSFACPADGRVSQPAPDSTGRLGAFTSYLGVEGGFSGEYNGALGSSPGARLADITDGTSGTLMVGERPPAAAMSAGWWYTLRPGASGPDHQLPAEAAIDPTLPRYCPANPQFGPGRIDNVCDVRHFWSLHGGGALFALADGSVRFLRYSIERPVFRALATRAGGEPAQVPD